MEDRFIQESGTNVYTGCELLVKGVLEGEVNLLTGYPGSPLAEVFDVMKANAALLKEHGILAQIGNNEALSVARLNGSQMANLRAAALYEERRDACGVRCVGNQQFSGDNGRRGCRRRR